MLIDVAEAVRLQEIDQYRGASLLRDPRIRSTTRHVNALVRDAQCRSKIDLDIRRTYDGWTDCRVWTSRTSVGIRWNKGFVTQSTLRRHVPSSAAGLSKGDASSLGKPLVGSRNATVTFVFFLFVL